MRNPTLLAILLATGLPLPAAQSVDTTWLAEAKQQSKDKAAENWQMTKAARATLETFHAPDLLQAPITTQDMPAAQTGKLVAVSDGGLIFDTEQSRLIYIRNVRVNDARLRLRASQQLIVQLEHKNKAQASAALKSPPASPSNNSTSQSAAPAVPEANKQQTVPASPQAPGASAPIPEISAPVAIIDIAKNRILLSSDNPAEPVRIVRGEDLLEIGTSAQTRTDVLADEAGNLYITGSSLILKWRDRNGQLAELTSPTASAYYDAARQSFVLEGACDIRHPQGSISCQENLSAILEGTSPRQPARQNFMGQFSNMHISGIRQATARGDVRIRTNATEEHPESQARADQLNYDGRNGTCQLTGKNCQLIYGTNRLHTNDRIELEENGDIIVLGSTIDGTYTRPSQAEPGQTVSGTFTAQNEVHLNAADGIVRTPNGMNAQDSEASFSCSGPVELQLARGDTPATVPAREKVGMLNLAVMQYRSIAQLKARDNVRVNFNGKISGQQPVQTGSITGDYLETNIQSGTMRIDTREGRPAILVFGPNKIEAQSPGETAHIELLPNGDIDVKGSSIHTTVTGEEGTTSAQCRNSLHLERSSGILTTGEAAEVHAPSGIFTANGPLTITLARDTAKEQEPTSRHPQLTYPYAGVSRIRTDQGGTLRTTTASMQCSGPVDIELDPTAAPRTGDTGNIIRATASGRVAILGKDNQGRLLRATGDRIEIDAKTGDKTITGQRVTLSNQYNTHTASGAGAAVRVDRHNNARITGARQTTTATEISKQVEANKQPQK